MDSRLSFLTIILLSVMACSSANSSSEEIENSNVRKDRPVQDCTPMTQVTYSEGIAHLDNAPLSGKVCSYHPNGKMHTLTTYSEGRKSGMWEIYFADGQREKSGFTRKGKDDGLYREWYPNGQLKYEYHYDLGKKTDVWKSWYEDGTPYTERHFKDDQLHGKVLVWDERGKLSKEYDYVNGRLMNSQMHFKEEGF